MAERRPTTAELLGSLEGARNLKVKAEDFAARCRELADEFGSVANLARATGIPDGTMRHYMNGKAEPGRDSLILLAWNAGVTVEWLATGETPKYLNERQVADGDQAAYAAPGEAVLRFAVRLKDVRRARGFAETGDVAAAIGIPPGRYDSLETGRIAPTIEDLLAIAGGLDVSLDYLVAGQGIPRLAHSDEGLSASVAKFMRALQEMEHGEPSPARRSGSD